MKSLFSPRLKNHTKTKLARLLQTLALLTIGLSEVSHAQTAGIRELPAAKSLSGSSLGGSSATPDIKPVEVELALGQRRGTQLNLALAILRAATNANWRVVSQHKDGMLLEYRHHRVQIDYHPEHILIKQLSHSTTFKPRWVENLSVHIKLELDYRHFAKQIDSTTAG